MAENLQDLKKQIDQLRKEIKNLGGETFADMNAAIKAFGGGIEGAKKLITSMNNDVEDLRDTFGSISSTLKNIVQDLKGAPDPVKETTKSFSKLESLANKISAHRKNEEILTVKQLKNIQKQTDAEVKRLKELEKQLDKQSDAYKEVNDALNEKTGLLKDINEQVKKELETEQKLQKTLGVTGGLFKGITKSLEHIGIESEHFEKINEDLREAAKSGNTFKVLGAGIKSVGSSVKEAFKDPLFQIAASAKALHSMIEFAQEFNQESVNIQRNLGLNFDVANKMNLELEHMAQHMGNTHKETIEANLTMNEFLGTSVLLSEKQLKDQVALTKNAGLEADVREGIYKYSLLTGKTQEEIFNSVGKQNKGVLSNKKVLSEIVKTSGQLSAQYKNNPELIGKAVIQAQKLGMTLEQTKNISKGLLNFEESISAELEAELLTGEDLNLEKARYLALQGDSAGAAEELMNNLGPNGLSKFQKMNVIQQEAYARALGMSADELANALIKQKQLSALNSQEREKLKKKVEALKAEGKIDEANKLEALAIEEKSVDLAGQKLSQQEEMAKSAEKLKTSFMTFMAGPLSTAMEKIGGLMKAISDNEFLKAIVGGVGIATAVLSVVSLGKGLVNIFRSRPSGRKGDAIHTIIDGGGRGGGGGMGDSVSSEVQERYSRRYGKKAGRKRFGGKGFGGKIGGILGGLGAAVGLSSMFGGDSEEAPMEDMTSAAAETMPNTSNKPPTPPPATASPKPSPAAAPKGKSFWGKVGSFFGGIGEKIGKGLGGVKSFFSGPIAKGFGKVLGPIFTIIESIGGAASLISDARERKAQGEKIDAGKLGKSLVQSAAYPIANASMNLIPGIGTAISLADGILGAFGLSPIKWLTDNLVGLVPDSAFTGLGNLALGEKAMAEGGIVTGPTRALVGEAGAEAVIPLNEFYAKLDQLIAAVRQGGNVYLDMQKVGTTVDQSTYKLNS
jgi:hypothetical protein